MVRVRSRSHSVCSGLRSLLRAAFWGPSRETGLPWVREIAVACTLEAIYQGADPRVSRELTVWAYDRRARRWTEGKS